MPDSQNYRIPLCRSTLRNPNDRFSLKQKQLLSLIRRELFVKIMVGMSLQLIINEGCSDSVL